MDLHLPNMLKNASKIKALAICTTLEKLESSSLNARSKKLLLQFLSSYRTLLSDRFC